MKIVIIRSCDRDDLRAKLCYETFKKYNVADKYIFFHEGENHPYISSLNEEIIHREFCDNFGGGSNVLTMINEMRKLPTFSDFDSVIFCDADIILYANPYDIMPANAEHAGIFDNNKNIGGVYDHISGQFNIVSGLLWNIFIENGKYFYREAYNILTKLNYSIADDTIFSVFSKLMEAKQYSFSENQCWLHYKIQPHEYEQYLNYKP